MKAHHWFVYSLLFLTLLSGCALHLPPPAPVTDHAIEMEDSNLVRVSYKITDRLIANLKTPLDAEKTVLVSSFVDVKHMERTSDFGRVMAECITSRLSQSGFTVVEMKLRNSVYIKERAGEFLLSRRVRDMSTSHNAQAVVVGTYALANTDLYLSSRIVQAADGKIISSCDYRLPLTPNLRAMFYGPLPEQQ